MPGRGGMRAPYPSDLSDREYHVLLPHSPAPAVFGRPWKHPLREILGGIFYVLRTGCQWRALPREVPRVGPRTNVRYIADVLPFYVERDPLALPALRCRRRP